MVRLAGCVHLCVFVRLALSKMTSALKETGVASETLSSTEAAVTLAQCCEWDFLETETYSSVSFLQVMIALWGHRNFHFTLTPLFSIYEQYMNT